MREYARVQGYNVHMAWVTSDVIPASSKSDQRMSVLHGWELNAQDAQSEQIFFKDSTKVNVWMPRESRPTSRLIISSPISDLWMLIELGPNNLPTVKSISLSGQMILEKMYKRYLKIRYSGRDVLGRKVRL